MSEQKTISAFFEEDYDRLDVLFKSFQTLKRQDFAKAKSAWVDFKVGLQRHIVCEEDVLFPLWEEKTGMTEGGPTFVMRLEHREIGECLEAIHRKVEARDPASDQQEQALLDSLERHNMTEEQVLYPAIDRSTSADERETVFRNINGIPEDRYKVSCGQR